MTPSSGGRSEGSVYEEFEVQLAALAKGCRGHPRREMVKLFLLALEREQLVSVAYRESLVERRLAEMALPDAAKELVKSALLWTWKDEEMHAIYIRGVLLRLGSAPLRLRTFAQQMAGGVGGWASSVRHHVRFSRAPLSRSLATLVTWLGLLTGKVPASVRTKLDYGSFRDFCLFNIDAERTAALCWDRLTALAKDHGEDPALGDEFAKITADEFRHERVLTALAEALTPDDALAVSVESLAESLREIGDVFLPRRLRRGSFAENTIGSGAPVFVVEGNELEDGRSALRRVLESSRLADNLAARARAAGAPLRVAIRPTFILAYNRRDDSPMTDPALVEELALFLHGAGCADVAVVEQRNIYEQFYRNRSVREVAAYAGFASPHYRVVDLSEEQVPHVFPRGMAQYTIARTWKEADVRIVFGKLRSHPVEFAALAITTLEGLGERNEAFLFPERRSHRETALMTLLSEFPPHFALLDAWANAPDGLLGVMGCPRPKNPRRIYASADTLALDLVAARHMGLEDPRRAPMLKAACDWFGAPGAPLAVHGVDTPWSGGDIRSTTSSRPLSASWRFPSTRSGAGAERSSCPRPTRRSSLPRGTPAWGFASRARRSRRRSGFDFPALPDDPRRHRRRRHGRSLGRAPSGPERSNAKPSRTSPEASPPGPWRASRTAGPYILLDRPGLEWAFQHLGLDLDVLDLRRVEDVYEVTFPDGAPVHIRADLEETMAVIEARWPGSGRPYRAFIESTARVYQELQPLQHVARPSPRDLLARRAFRGALFLLRSLRSVLESSGLPGPVVQALGIWTHVAGQRLDTAPSPFAFVPALVHTVGCYVPANGIGAIPRLLATEAEQAGVSFRHGLEVKRIVCEGGRAVGVELADGERIEADAVLSNHSGVGTYLDLLTVTPEAQRAKLGRLPLQLPGVSAYLAVRGEPRPPYLRFRLPGGDELCRLLIQPGVVLRSLERDGGGPRGSSHPCATRTRSSSVPKGSAHSSSASSRRHGGAKDWAT